MNIAICEDDQQPLTLVIYLLERYAETHPGTELVWRGYTYGGDLLERLDGEKRYDLYLLDVLMPELSGIDVAKEIRQRQPEALIVFLTSSARYALDAYHVSALQYLLKPLREEALFPVLDKAFSLLDSARQEPRFFLIPTSDKIMSVLLSSLVCVEGYKRTLRAHLLDGSQIQSKPYRSNFNSVVSPLLEDGRFLRVHQSYVLNMEYVKTVTDCSFIMASGVEIFVPRYKFSSVKAQYISYALRTSGGLQDAPAGPHEF